MKLPKLIFGNSARAQDAALSAGQATKADVDNWRQLLDPKLVSEQVFLELFQIKTDVQEDPISGEVPDPWVSFTWREVQHLEYDQIEEFMRERRPTRLRIPKSRGQGVSSFNLALYAFCRILRIPGYETKVIAQDQDESEEHLARLNDFYDQVDWVALKELGIVRVKSTRKAIVIQFGDMRRSKVRVITAKKQGLGRGGGSDAIITTERPHWPQKSKKDLTGLLSRLSRSRWSAHIDESSANGFDEFYTDCMKAEKGRGGYRLLFLPAYRRPNNYLRAEEFNREELLSDLGAREEFGLTEELEKRSMVAAYWRNEHLLENEAADEMALRFLAWRRLAIEGECSNSLTYFWREHPCTLEEAFQGTGRPVFDLPRLRTWVEAARRLQETGVTFAIETRDHGVRAVPRWGALWRVYETPKEGADYTFGVDVARGYEVEADGKKESDFSVVIVAELTTGRTVAKLRAHIQPHLLAWEIVLMAHWYNDAQGLVEINNDGGTVVAFVISYETDWGKGEDCLLTTTRQVKTSTGLEKRDQFGWWTSGGTGGTKHFMVGQMHRYQEEVGRFRPAADDGPMRSPWDYDTIQEKLLFVHTIGGGMEAEKGHDDCVVAEGLKEVARQMRIADGDFPTQSAAKPVKPESDVKRALREQDARTQHADELEGAHALADPMPGF